MSEIKKAPGIPPQLQRAALSTQPHSSSGLLEKGLLGSVITTLTSTSPSMAELAKLVSSEVDPISRAVRKQANPVKQPVVVPFNTVSRSPATSSGLQRTTKLNNAPPPPPPLISALSARTLGKETTTVRPSDKNQTALPASTDGALKNGETTASKKTEAGSSESSSDDSSSDSTSGEEEETAKNNKTNVTPVVDSEVPGPSTAPKRGRGRPKLNQSSTPRPAKQGKPGKERARTTPRKKSERVPKPPAIFSPDTASGKTALPKRRGRGCGGCVGCMREDCGKCNYCKDKTKFGGPGRKKQRCLLRACTNFVNPLHGKGRKVNPATPPGEVSVIPVTKLANSLKVAEVIEQLRQNLTSAIPPVIDKESLPGLLPILRGNPTSFILSHPQPLKTTPTTVSTSETKIIGPVTPPSMVAKTPPTSEVPVSSAPSAPAEVAEVTNSEPCKSGPPKTTEATKSADTAKQAKKEEAVAMETAATTKPTETSKAPEISKSSEIALRTRRKQQQVKVATSSTSTTQSSSDDKVKCIVCGRERKPSLMRSSQFCTQRCINIWSEKNGKGAESVSSPRGQQEETKMEVDKAVSGQQQPKRMPRALKNLQIDMTWDRTTIPSTQKAPPTFSSTVGATPKPTITSTPTPTATTATNKRPTSSTGIQPTTKRLTKELEVVVGTKRPSPQQPPQNQKKMKEAAEPAKSVSFNLINIPTDPISAPPLSRTVPPPSISIVPLDQLTALGTALLTQQQQQRKKDDTPAVAAFARVKIPTSLPLDVRTWSTTQVVKFFESTSDCKDYAAVFREQEVDGTALLLLTHESLVKCLGIKLGRALKIMVHVEELQKLYA